jgi:chromosome segregation ATPase
LKLAHENAIHKQQVSSLRRELQQLRERFESEQRAQERVLLSKEDLVGRHQREILALKEASAKRDTEIESLKAEQDRTNAEKDQLAASLDARTNRLNVVEAAHRELEQEYAKVKAQREAEQVASIKEVLSNLFIVADWVHLQGSD